jgi:UV excision repair protein RAD23
MGGLVQIELTEEEAAAVGRLEALGFSRQACLQAYIACEKQEELAANYLLNSMNEED